MGGSKTRSVGTAVCAIRNLISSGQSEDVFDAVSLFAKHANATTKTQKSADVAKTKSVAQVRFVLI